MCEIITNIFPCGLVWLRWVPRHEGIHFFSPDQHNHHSQLPPGWLVTESNFLLVSVHFQDLSQHQGQHLFIWYSINVRVFLTFYILMIFFFFLDGISSMVLFEGFSYFYNNVFRVSGQLWDFTNQLLNLLSNVYLLLTTVTSSRITQWRYKFNPTKFYMGPLHIMGKNHNLVLISSL